MDQSRRPTGVCARYILWYVYSIPFIGVFYGCLKYTSNHLTSIFSSKGAKHWNRISDGVPGRSGKQCRERWSNHLNPAVIRGIGWSEQEDRQILETHILQGNKWAMLSRRLMRSDNAVKNRWNSCLRRGVERYLVQVMKVPKGRLQNRFFQYKLPFERVNDCIQFIHKRQAKSTAGNNTNVECHELEESKTRIRLSLRDSNTTIGAKRKEAADAPEEVSTKRIAVCTATASGPSSLEREQLQQVLRNLKGGMINGVYVSTLERRHYISQLRMAEREDVDVLKKLNLSRHEVEQLPYFFKSRLLEREERERSMPRAVSVTPRSLHQSSLYSRMPYWSIAAPVMQDNRQPVVSGMGEHRTMLNPIGYSNQHGNHAIVWNEEEKDFLTETFMDEKGLSS